VPARRFLLVAALLVAAACGDDDAASTTTTTATTEAATETDADRSTTTTSEPASTAPVRVVVEDRGQEPRRALRLGVGEGDEDPVTQRQELSLRVDVGGEVQDSPSPVTEIDLTWRVGGADDERLEVQGTYDAVRILETPGVDPATMEATRQSLQGFEGATVQASYTRHGAALAASFDELELPEGPAGEVAGQLLSGLTDTIESLSVPFPDEAVGVGARWRVDAEVVVAGLPMEVTTTVRLDELTADRATGTLDQVVRYVPGDVEAFGAPATVIGGEVTGSGPIVWDLAGGLLPRSDVRASGWVAFEVQGVRVEQQQTQRITVSAR